MKKMFRKPSTNLESGKFAYEKTFQIIIIYDTPKSHSISASSTPRYSTVTAKVILPAETEYAAVCRMKRSALLSANVRMKSATTDYYQMKLVTILIKNNDDTLLGD